MDGLNDSEQLQPTAKSRLMECMTQTKSSESVKSSCPGSKNCEKDQMKEDPKSSLQPRPLEILTVLQSASWDAYQRPLLELVGHFRVWTEGDWLRVTKIMPGGSHFEDVVISQMAFFRPISWQLEAKEKI